MKTIKYILLLSILLIFSGVANALPIPTTWTDTMDKGQWISTGSTFNFALDGYRPGIDSISSATLNIDLFGGGRGEIKIDNIQTQKYSFLFYTDLNIPLTVTVGLSETGKLTVIFDKVWGIQWLNSITLTATGYKGSPAPVPEPATMLLLGSGFIGLAFYGRKRMKG